VQVKVDHATFRAELPLPSCPLCGSLARPNILMFYDRLWSPIRFDRQQARYEAWEKSIQGKGVVIEFGAGTAIPSVRIHSEDFARRRKATLIRINPREAQGPLGTISIETGALEALQSIRDARRA
jgi:hypothetical protein